MQFATNTGSLTDCSPSHAHSFTQHVLHRSDLQAYGCWKLTIHSTSVTHHTTAESMLSAPQPCNWQLPLGFSITGCLAGFPSTKGRTALTLLGNPHPLELLIGKKQAWPSHIHNQCSGARNLIQVEKLRVRQHLD